MISAALTRGRIITGLSRLAFWALLETGDRGLADPDNPGLEPSKQPVTSELWFSDGKAACTGLVGMADTRDNSHVNGKLLNDDDDNDDDDTPTFNQLKKIKAANSSKVDCQLDDVF